MKYIFKLALKNILYNKKHSQLNVFAMALSTAILYTSIILLMNLYVFSTPKVNTGNFHYLVHNPIDYHLPNQYTVTKDSVTPYQTLIDQNIFELHTLNNKDVLPFQIISGTLPKKYNEIMVSNNLNFKIDELIDLSITNQETSMTENKIYKVVGIYETNDNFNHCYLYICSPEAFTNSYYIRDEYFYISDSSEAVSELMNLSNQELIINHQLIASEKLQAYFQETNLIYILFIVIILLDFLITYITLKNVSTVYENSRKRDIGLLKSVGATSKQIKQMIRYENILVGVFSSFIGVFIGICISLFITQTIVNTLFLTFKLSMIIHPLALLLSLLFGCSISLVSGTKSQKQYLYTHPIDDLKENPYEYPAPIKTKSLNANKFSWRMFLIYNHRLRAHTTNVRQSFLLQAISMLLLIFIIFSNITYQNIESINEYDIYIHNNTFNGEYSTLHFDFVYALYDEYENGKFDIDYVSVERKENVKILTLTEMYIYNRIQHLQDTLIPSIYIGLDKERREWCDYYQYPTILDKHQLEALQPYIKDGELENLDEDAYIIILWGGSHFADYAARMSRASQGFPIAVYTGSSPNLKEFISSNDLRQQNKKIQAVAKLPLKNNERFTPDSTLYELHLPLENAEYTVAKSYITLKDGNLFNGTEDIKIKLKNSSLTYEFANRLTDLMNQYDVIDVYDYEFGPANNEKIETSILLIEVLLFPLCALLFIISFFNVINVTNGNIIIKQDDFRILNSIGMTYKQTRNILIYEYLEGYFNASIVVLIITAIISVITQYFEYISVLNIGSNLTSAYMVSNLLINPLIIAPACYMSIQKAKKVNRAI